MDAADAAVARGRDALSRRSWTDASHAFTQALTHGDRADAYEGLAEATAWLDDDRAIDAYERAYALYREAGDDAAAARVAAFTAMAVHDFRGQLAVVRGWLARAKSLTEGDPKAVESHALAVGLEGYMTLLRDSQPAAALPSIREARRVMHDAGDTGPEMTMLALEGLAQVTLGEVTAGMGMLDEASAAVTAGDVIEPIFASTIYCFVINACERVRDVDRAGQWCDAMAAYCARVGDDAMGQQCRTLYAGVLLSRGAWPEAETSLQEATGRLRQTRPAIAADGLVRLADLRRRQGRLNQAAALYVELEGDPFRAQAEPLATLGRGELALARGDAVAAVDDADRYLRMLEPDERARTALEDAVDRFGIAGAPYDTAVAQALLAVALHASGRMDRARDQDRAATATLAALGAVRPAWIPAIDGEPAVDDPAGLSTREREILRMMAAGLSNEDIAARLVLSIRTVERHVSNIYAKLGAAGRNARAVATAYAHEHELV